MSFAHFQGFENAIHDGVPTTYPRTYPVLGTMLRHYIQYLETFALDVEIVGGNLIFSFPPIHSNGEHRIGRI